MKHIIVLALTGLSALFFVTPAAAQDNPDVQLFLAQEQLAMKGRPEAQYYLGEMYEQGLGTKPNLDNAFKWYKNSAEQGNRLAKHKLARRDEIVSQQARDIADEMAAEQARQHAKAAGAGKGTQETAADQAAAEQRAAEAAENLRLASLSRRAKRQAAVRAMLQKIAEQPYHEPFE